MRVVWFTCPRCGDEWSVEEPRQKQERCRVCDTPLKTSTVEVA